MGVQMRVDSPMIERVVSTMAMPSLAAWIAYDADLQLLSRQLNQEGLMASRLAGDRNMELFQLANLAMQSVYLRRSAEALQVSEAVLTERLSGRTAALFHVRRARALAQGEYMQRSLAALDQAESLLDNGLSGNDPPWTWWLDESELTWHRAMCFADFGEPVAALDFFHKAYELRPTQAHRGRYNDLAHVLDAQVTVGAWHAAEATLLAVIPYTHEISSRRTATLLRRSIDTARKARAPSSTFADAADDLLMALE